MILGIIIDLSILRFRPAAVKELIHKELIEYLLDKSYSSEEASTWSKEISDNLISRLKGYQPTRTRMLSFNHCVCYHVLQILDWIDTSLWYMLRLESREGKE